MSETARPRLRLGLVALNAALVLLLVGIEWWAKRPLPPLPASSPVPVRPIRLAPLTDAPMPLALRGAYARAPLFNPDRKPDPIAATRSAAPPQQGMPILTGVVFAPGWSLALIRIGTQRANALSKGDPVPGSNWVVQCIQPHHVCLDDGGQRLRLALKAVAPAGEDETPSAPIATTRPPIPSHPLAIRVPMMAKPYVPSAPQSTAVRHAHVARASTRPTPPSAHL
jgi:hypothetical protein